MGGTRGKKRAATNSETMWNSKSSKKKMSTAAIATKAETLFQEVWNGAAQQIDEDELDTEQLNMEGTRTITVYSKKNEAVSFSTCCVFFFS